MRLLLMALLVAGCSEHGSMAPDALLADAKLFKDAQVMTCFARDGSASVTASPGGAFGRVYAGGVVGGGLVAPATSVGTLHLLFTNAPEAGYDILWGCDGHVPTCTTDGLSVVARDAPPPGAELGSHPVTIVPTTGADSPVDGNVTITELVSPFDSLPGHITGTIAATTTTLTVSGSFSTPFCPPFFAFPI